MRPPTSTATARHAAALLTLLGLASLNGCSTGLAQDSVADPGPPPAGTDPREQPEYWPRTLSSTALPLTVHYRVAEEAAMAKDVLRGLERAWTMETEVLGFRAPLLDGGQCGADERFDVFLWRGLIECSVVAFASNPATPHDDWLTYMLLDPFGPYGGDALEATLAHELNHACQAADDWWESEWFFEASATYVEALVQPEHPGWHEQLRDFQAHPDWSLTRNDEYETWFMYGAALYFHFVAECYYDRDPTFLAQVWYGARNSPGGDADPPADEPDFEDALDRRLRADAGVSYLDSVLTFARWRWFTGARDDGRHFADGALFAEVSSSSVAVPARWVLEPAPMILGSSYLTLAGEPGATVRLSLQLPEGSPEVVVQTLTGSAPDGEGERLDLSRGAAQLLLDAAGARTLAITVLPDRDGGPDSRTDVRHPVTVVLETTASRR